MGLRDILLARRDAGPSPMRMVGFPSDGGLISAGVTGTSALGLSAVWRCIDILSNGVAQLPWEEVRADAELPPSRLVLRPQAQRTRREWTSLVVSTLALYDVCYLLKVGGLDSEGVTVGLWPLDPSIVSPVTSDTWSFLPPDEYYISGTRMSADNIVVLHRSPQPGVADGLGGVIQMARVTFAAAQAAEAYASRYWQAGGAPTTVLETDANMPPEVGVQFSDRWRERRSMGPDYAPVLSGGLKAKQFGADPTAQAAVEARKEQVADIGRYFGVPTRILNAPAGDTETYATSKSGNMDLVRYTLSNYIHAIEDAISDQLPGGRQMRMETATLTAGTQLAQAQALQLATGNKAWMTPDEAREVWHLAPMESPDTLNPAPVTAPFGGIDQP